MDKEKELENIAELQRIVDKEILKTLEWITFVMEEDRSKTNLRTALDKATAILDYLNKLQNILGKIKKKKGGYYGFSSCTYNFNNSMECLK